VYSVWAIYEQVCVAACDCGHLKLAKVLLSVSVLVTASQPAVACLTYVALKRTFVIFIDFLSLHLRCIICSHECHTTSAALQLLMTTYCYYYYYM